MGKLIVGHGGTLERFTGDGMMIFFNDPVVVPDPAVRALRMAVAMRERVDEMSAVWRKDAPPGPAGRAFIEKLKAGAGG